MAEKEDFPTLGRVVDGGTRTGGTGAVRNALLPAPHNEYQSADLIVQSPALLLPAGSNQEAPHSVVDPFGSHVYPVHDWQYLPALC